MFDMKCTESEDEPVTQGKEDFLQLSCFISADVKYMLSGLRNVSVFNSNRQTRLLCAFFFNFFVSETPRANHKTIAHARKRRCLFKNKQNQQTACLLNCTVRPVLLQGERIDQCENTEGH